MPSSPRPAPAPPATPTLADLRAELDRLDDGIHDLLMRRAAVVARIPALGGKGRVALRPGREAEILRRLLRRHGGPLPRMLLVRLWRELFAATTGMQQNHLIAVCETYPGNASVQCAREHFGALTPLRVHGSAPQAIAEVSAGTATAAVLPMPAEADNAAWWTALLHHDEPRIHVVARLPFWAPRPEGAPQVQALVVAAVAPDPSSHDRTLIGAEVPADISRARLAANMAAAGFVPGTIVLRRDEDAQTAQAVVDVEGYVTDNDARLAALIELTRPPVVLGAYAVPVDGETA